MSWSAFWNLTTFAKFKELYYVYSRRLKFVSFIFQVSQFIRSNWYTVVQTWTLLSKLPKCQYSYSKIFAIVYEFHLMLTKNNFCKGFFIFKALYYLLSCRFVFIVGLAFPLFAIHSFVGLNGRHFWSRAKWSACLLKELSLRRSQVPILMTNS